MRVCLGWLRGLAICLVVFSGVGSDCAAGCGVVDFCFLTLVDVGLGMRGLLVFRFCVGLV